MSHVYVSYTNEDRDYVDLVEAELAERGHSAWRDTSQIPDGEDWEQAITEALGNAYAILVMLSHSALQSEWVVKEIQFATDHEIPLVVIHLDHCDVPTMLDDAPIINFQRINETQGVEQLNLYRQSMSTLVSSLEEVRPVLRHIRALRNADDVIREHSAQQLGELGDPVASQALIAVLSDPDVDVRYAAAQALGKLKSESALKPLIRMLTDDDPDVVAASVTSLGALGQPEAISELEELLGHHDRFVRAATALALGHLHATNTVRTLIFLMRNDSIGDVRRAAAQALCMIGGTQATHALKRAGIRCQDIL